MTSPSPRNVMLYARKISLNKSMAFSPESLPSSNQLLTAAASVIGTVVLLKSFANELIPHQIHNYFSSSLLKFSSQLTLVIEEFDALTPNHMFEASNLYLGTKISPSIRRIKVNKSHKEEDLAVTVDKNQQITDVYGKIKFQWVLQSEAIKPAIEGSRNGNSATELRFRTVKLHTIDYNGTDYWSSVALNHPARFDSMAMDPGTKRDLIEDLDRFVKGKDYYRRVGKAWKRGYLFYGPPGTGKSSLVAAMANHLKFDVYDLDLREVQCNSDLRRLLIGTANRSILVIEDIDCNVGLMNRDADNAVTEDDKITLSGLLNFVDGLWSSCGDERIIVFTTNHKDRLDPALVRPGRMDVQLEMSYCTFSGFKILAATYLRVEEHALFPVIQDLLGKVEATPAQVAGELMKSCDADIALPCLVQFLKDKETIAQ